MNRIIEAAFARSRTIILMLAFVLGLGAYAYVSIPKEAAPDVPIPTIYVVVTLQGISPEDAERLLVRPLETELQSVEGLDEMKSVAAEGTAAVTLTFDPGFDSDRALRQVREAVDRARAELPANADEPLVNEVNVALFPILTVMLSGPLPERTLADIATRLEEDVEAIPGVLEVDVGGKREQMLEVLVDPTVLRTYDISFETLLSQIQRNNRLVAAGALDTGAGRIVLKVPGIIEKAEDVFNLPVKVVGGTVVTFGDVAQLRRTFRDPDSFARIDGQPAVALEVKKRLGANIIETVEAVRAAVARAQPRWPETLQVEYLQDESEQVRTLLSDLENNVLTASFLVMIVIVATLGLRNALLVGLAIPGSFLGGVIVLYGLGFTMNIVVLFSLILVVGMLVDGAIVTTELADRRLAEGRSPREAYAEGARRMAWPIITSTATTLAVFLPLLFWSGTVGEFMKFLPITVLVTLSASLLMALIFIPVVGGMIGRAGARSDRQLATLRAAETGDLDRIGGFTGRYVRLLGLLARRPLLTLSGALALLVAAYVAYGMFGRGIEFFPRIEPEFAQIQVQARDNLSIREKDRILRDVERRVIGMREIESVYSRTVGERLARSLPEDTIGVIQLELVAWDRRRTAAAIIEDIRTRAGHIPGIRLQVREQRAGPSGGKPIELRVFAPEPATLRAAVARIRGLMNEIGGFVDVEDGRSLPGVEWQLVVDRIKAARHGADVTLLGQAVQLVTLGILVAEYRPDDAEDPVEIRVRFPPARRTLSELARLFVPTARGQVPIQNFVSFQPAPKTGTLNRIDARRVVSIAADVAPGLLVNDQVAALRRAIMQADLPPSVRYEFAGETEDQQQAAAFLMVAFLVAIFLMLIVLVTQFNSIYQAILVLSAIVFSTAGVFLGLLVTGRPFGVVMGGIGVIALAGIVVNNNIVLIDTFNELRRRGVEPLEAVLRTGAQRLRPVLLTSVTTVLGLMPMVLAMNVDLIGRDIAFGAPSTQWWTELSSAVAGGLTFATFLTLILTPALLMLGARTAAWWRRRRQRRAAA